MNKDIKNVIKKTAQAKKYIPVMDGTKDVFSDIAVSPASLNLNPGDKLPTITVTANRRNEKGTYGHKDAVVPVIMPNTNVFIIHPQRIFRMAGGKGKKPTSVAPNERISLDYLKAGYIRLAPDVAPGNYPITLYYSKDGSSGFIPMAQLALTVAGAPEPPPATTQEDEFNSVYDAILKLNNFVLAHQARVQQLLMRDTKGNDYLLFHHIQSALWKFIKTIEASKTKPEATAASKEGREVQALFGRLTEAEQAEIDGIINRVQSWSSFILRDIYKYAMKYPRDPYAIALNQLYSAMYMAVNNRNGMAKYYKSTGGRPTGGNPSAVLSRFTDDIYEYSKDGRSIDLSTASKILKKILNL